MNVTSLLAIALGAILTNNFILVKFLGICPFMGVSKKTDTALGMGVAVTFVMALASMVTWAVDHYILTPLDLGYMQTAAFILIIAAIVQVVEMFLKKSVPTLYQALGIYLPLITTNCAVLGVTVLNITGPFVGQDTPYTFLQSMANSLGSGLGFFLAMVIFAGVRTRTESCEAPESFQGLPITLVSASILAAAFNGFAGVVETLFG